MTKSGMVLKLTNRMRKHQRDESEIAFERRNIADWFDACKESSVNELQAKESRLLISLDRAESAGDMAYLECRQLFLDIVHNFLPDRLREIPF